MLITLNSVTTKYVDIYCHISSHRIMINTMLILFQDTNPIFLFNKNTIESAVPPSSSDIHGLGKYDRFNIVSLALLFYGQFGYAAKTVLT